MLDALHSCWDSTECPIIRGATKQAEGVMPVSEEEVNNKVEDEPFKRNHLIEVSESQKDSENHNSYKHSGIGDVIKGMTKIDPFSGSYGENIVEIFEKYEATCDMVELSEEQMFKGLNMLFKGTALSFFLSNVRDVVKEGFNTKDRYREAVKLMIKEYTSEDQKRRLLDEWRTVSLLDWFK